MTFRHAAQLLGVASICGALAEVTAFSAGSGPAVRATAAGCAACRSLVAMSASGHVGMSGMVCCQASNFQLGTSFSVKQKSSCNRPYSMCSLCQTLKPASIGHCPGASRRNPSNSSTARATCAAPLANTYSACSVALSNAGKKDYYGPASSLGFSIEQLKTHCMEKCASGRPGEVCSAVLMPQARTGLGCAVYYDNGATSASTCGTLSDGSWEMHLTCKVGHVSSSPCAKRPCKNGGGCMAMGHQGFSCVCRRGFEGTTCDTDIDDCASAPCENGATCFDGKNAYTCTCRAGFTGANCGTAMGSASSGSQEEVDYCASAPCENGGMCTVEKGLGYEYTCTCRAGFGGAHCEEAMDSSS